MPQASKHTENTGLQKIEIDAAGIKTRRRHRRRQESASDSHGFLAPVTAIPAHCSFVFSASFGSRSLYLGPFSFRVFRVFRRPSLPRLARRFLPTEHAEDTEGGLGKTFGSICAYAGTEDLAPPVLTRKTTTRVRIVCGRRRTIASTQAAGRRFYFFGASGATGAGAGGAASSATGGAAGAVPIETGSSRSAAMRIPVQ